MDHSRIEEENLAERYLLGRLATDEAARFEEHYLDCPECLDRLELSRRLERGLKETAAEDGERLAQSAVLAWLARRGWAARSGVATVLATLVILPWMLLVPEVRHLDQELDQARAPLARTPVYALSPERSGPGEAPSTRITLGSAVERVALVLQLPPEEKGTTFRVQIRQPGEEPLWRSGPLTPDLPGRITLSVHSTWLRPADYAVELTALGPEGGERPVARFAFRVRQEE